MHSILKQIGITILLLGWIGAGPWAHAKPALTVSRSHPRPTQEVRTQWLDTYLKGDEIWVFRNIQSLNQFLDGKELDPSILEELHQSSRLPLSRDDTFRIYSWLKVRPPEQVYVRISAPLKAKLSPEFIQSAYYRQAEEDRLPRITFGDHAEARDTFKEFGLTEAVTEALLKQLMPAPHGALMLPLTQEAYRSVPGEHWLSLFPMGLSTKPNQTGIQVTLQFGPNDDLPQLAESLAGPRKTEALIRYLSILRKRSPDGAVSIPLEKMMPLFIRKNINKFNSCSGPNCFNSGLNVPLTGKFRKKFDGTKTLMSDLEQNYRKVESNEKLRLGDLLLYTDSKGDPVHVVSYVTKDIVFTKNGINSLSPYIFQTKEAVESLYFKDQPRRFDAYRFQEPRKKPAPLSELAATPNEPAPRCSLSSILKWMKNWVR